MMMLPVTQIHSHYQYTATNLLLQLNGCNNMSQLKQIQALALRSTLPHHPQSLLLHSQILRFSSFKDLNYAFKLFDCIPQPNSFMWNTLIRACALSNDRKHYAFLLYSRMLTQGRVLPDNHTYPFLLKACAYLFAFSEGKQAHSHLIKLGFASDVYVINSLIHFYCSCGCLGSASKLFDKMSDRSLVSWNVMIDGLVRCGEFESALRLFVEMLQGLFDPDAYTIQSVLTACAGLTALSLGLWVHCYMLRNANVELNVLANNCLLDMYCKCGALDFALQIFESMDNRDLTSWNSIILGLAMHGKGDLALEYFNSMVKECGVVPNSITFVGVLSACNHNCMVNEGLEYFDLMVNEYEIAPQLEHYGCMVDILARAGLISKALDLASAMPMKPDAVIWRSLLDACCKKNDSIKLSEEMATKILESEGADFSGVYVLLSKAYASAGQWNNVGLVRKLMIDNGVMKEPGCTLIEIDGVSHEFIAGDTSHPQTKEIYQKLDAIEERLSSVGYTPDHSEASMVDEKNSEKQQSLRLHSERLAIALGLISLKPGQPIRIFKNLQVCRDCHTFTKLVSKVFNVEIVMRDRVRFHHFKDGFCSCKDYW